MISFVADVHIGNHSVFGGPVTAGVNARCAAILKALDTAVTKSAGTFVVAGDLFDTSAPIPQHITEVQRIFANAQDVVVLRGNHDMVSDVVGDHALGPLSALPNVRLVCVPTAVRLEDTALLCVPFQTGDAREWFADAVTEAAGQLAAQDAAHRVLVFHLGVIDSKTPPFLANAHDAISLSVIEQVMQQHNIQAAFCGNWHSAKVWSLPAQRRVVQVGALVPTGFDNPGWDYGRLRIYDPRAHMMRNEQVAGPRFVTATTQAEVAAAKATADQQGCALYLSLKGEVSSELAAVRELHGVAGARAAAADHSVAREATRAAARVVRKSATLDEALAKYISHMPISAGVERPRVLALCKSYLAQHTSS